MKVIYFNSIGELFGPGVNRFGPLLESPLLSHNKTSNHTVDAISSLPIPPPLQARPDSCNPSFMLDELMDKKRNGKINSESAKTSSHNKIGALICSLT